MTTQKPAIQSLSFKNRRKLPAHRLPFVGEVHGKIGLSFWTVPKAGGYRGGCQTGEALAHIYLKHLKDHESDSGLGSLQRIALDMFGCELEDSPEQAALRGQAVGFFSVLDAWLAGAAKHLCGGLDEYDNKTLLKAANTGLTLDTGA